MTQLSDEVVERVARAIERATLNDINGAVSNSADVAEEALEASGHAELRAAAADALSGWRYIRHHYGDLSGVGWDRVEDALVAALLKAQGTTDV